MGLCIYMYSTVLVTNARLTNDCCACVCGVCAFCLSCGSNLLFCFNLPSLVLWPVMYVVIFTTGFKECLHLRECAAGDNAIHASRQQLTFDQAVCPRFLDPEGRSQKATLVVLVLVVGISSLRVQKSLRLSLYTAERNDTLHTHSC